MAFVTWLANANVMLDMMDTGATVFVLGVQEINAISMEIVSYHKTESRIVFVMQGTPARIAQSNVREVRATYVQGTEYA